MGHSPGLHFINSVCFQWDVASALPAGPKAGLDFARAAEYSLFQEPILSLGVVAVLAILAEWAAEAGGRKMVNSRPAWTAQWDVSKKCKQQIRTEAHTYNASTHYNLWYISRPHLKNLKKKMERAHTSAPPGHSIIACDHMDQSIFFLPTTNVVGVKLGWEWAHSCSWHIFLLSAISK